MGMRSPLLLRRFASLLGRRGSEHETDYETMGTAEGGLEAEYLKVLEPELRGWGIPERCAALQVQQVGHTPHGRGIFVGVIRLVAWERRPAMRLLLGLPFLERRVKQALSTRWLLDVSHFGGLWLHASERLQNGEAGRELRELLAEFSEPPGGARQRPRV
jgi:hypothetical protein